MWCERVGISFYDESNVICMYLFILSRIKLMSLFNRKKKIIIKIKDKIQVEMRKRVLISVNQFLNMIGNNKSWIYVTKY